jgi:hypothetical protein
MRSAHDRNDVDLARDHREVRGVARLRIYHGGHRRTLLMVHLTAYAEAHGPSSNLMVPKRTKIVLSGTTSSGHAPKWCA